MKTGITTLFFAFFLFRSADAQPPGDNTRSLLSIMVVPYTFGNEDILLRLEKDTGYKNAISVINSALINMGYTKTLDVKTYKENIDDKNLVTGDKTWSEKINIYIEDAPVDIIIETEITCINPPGNPRDRQDKPRLKATDKCTSDIYADNGSIQFDQTKFPDR